MNKSLNNPNLKNQQGAALAVGLILLLLITLMGYTGMKGTMLQEKMAAGLHNRTLAYGGANSALRQGERQVFRLIEQTNGVVIEGTPDGRLFGVYSYYASPGNPAGGVNPVVEGFVQENFASEVGIDHDFDFGGTNVNENARLNQSPEYFIYLVDSPKTPGSGSNGAVTQEFGGGSSNAGANSIQDEQGSYVVTGKSSSGDGNSMAMLQSLYTVVGSSNPSQ